MGTKIFACAAGGRGGWEVNQRGKKSNELAKKSFKKDY